jgi:hypothetical protein
MNLAPGGHVLSDGLVSGPAKGLSQWVSSEWPACGVLGGEISLTVVLRSRHRA